MLKFRYQPPAVDAERYHAGVVALPGVTYPDYSTDPPTPAYVATPTGTKMPLADGDWVVYVRPGRGWPIHPDQFAAAYVPVPTSEPADAV